MRTVNTLTVLSIALSSSLCLAQAAEKKPAAAAASKPAAEKKPAAPEMPKPAAEMSQFKFFQGSWSCKGTGFATPMGPEHATTGKAKLQSDLNGFFLAVRYDEDKSKENPMPYHVAGHWTWDGEHKKFDAWGFDGFGGWSHQESPGWDGDKLVWSGDAMMMGKKAGARDTFTKKGDAELMHTGEVEMDGKWMKTDEETCTKGGAKAEAKKGEAKAEEKK